MLVVCAGEGRGAAEKSQSREKRDTSHTDACLIFDGYGVSNVGDEKTKPQRQETTGGHQRRYWLQA